MSAGRADRLLLVVEPLLILAGAVGVLWWAFAGDLTETQRALLNAGEIGKHIGEHLAITIAVTAIVLAVSIPLGIILTRGWARPLAPVAIGVANIGQAAPAIGLLVLLFLATGRTGFWAGVLPVAFYSLLPVLRNTILGIREVDPALLDAARGQGMTSRRILTGIELPLAVPFILSGLRTTLVLAVGTATLSFLVDAGGLGIYIDTGYRLQDNVTLIVGSVLAVCLALFVDWLGGIGELLLNPKGLA